MERVTKGDDDPVRNILGVAKTLVVLGIALLALGAVQSDNNSLGVIGAAFLASALVVYLVGQYLRGRQG